MKKWHVTVSGTFTEVYEVEAESAEQAKERYRTGWADGLDIVASAGEEQIEEVSAV